MKANTTKADHKLSYLKQLIQNIGTHFAIYKEVFFIIFNENKGQKLNKTISFFIIILSISLNVSLPLLLRHSFVYTDNLKRSLFSQIIIFYGACWIFNRVIRIIREMLMHKVIEQASKKFVLRVIKKIYLLSYQNLLNKKLGELSSLIFQIQRNLPEIFWWLFFYNIPTFLELIIVSMILTYFYGIFYGLGLILTFCIYCLCTALFSLKTITVLSELTKETTKTYIKISDSLINFQNIKFNYTYDHEFTKLDQQLEKQKKAAVSNRYITSINRLLQAFIIGCCYLIFIYKASLDFSNHSIQCNDFFIIHGYLIQFAIPLITLGNQIQKTNEGLNSIKKGIELINNNANESDIDFAEKHSKIIKGQIAFKNVSFGYLDNKLLLKNLSFTIPAGSTTAIVGLTGSGKSTLTKLLLRLYELNNGTIELDEQELTQYTHASLASIFSVVQQDNCMFNDSLLYNLTYGLGNISNEEIDNALRGCCIYDFAYGLPDKLNTTIGERGYKISGGEKQRIALARALLKMKSLLILDEATSFLDFYTERKIMDFIYKFRPNTTKVIIAHRLNTIIYADNILVLHDGKIIENGTFEYLISLKGLFYNLWSSYQIIQPSGFDSYQSVGILN